MKGEGTIAEVLAGEAAYAVVCGDCRTVLKGVPDGVAHVTYTDPPYGLSEQTKDDIVACLTAWLAGEPYVHSRRGFMNNEWDSLSPGPDVWREVERVLKPGGWLASFSSTRTVDLLGIAIRLSGFESRESWAWLFSASLPKGHDISKAIDRAAGATREVIGPDPNAARRNKNTDRFQDIYNTSPTATECPVTAPATPDAEKWAGYNIATRPSYEPIYVARKALDGTNVNNCLVHGAGALNIDGARIAPGANEPDSGAMYYKNRGLAMPENRQNYFRGEDRTVKCDPISGGRWPPGLAVCHEEECERAGTRTIAAMTGGKIRTSMLGTMNDDAWEPTPMERQVGHSLDAEGREVVDDWICVEGCAVRELARQSGECAGAGDKPALHDRDYEPSAGVLPPGFNSKQGPLYNDTGSAARFFWNAKASANDRWYWVTCTPGCQFHEKAVPVKEAEATSVEVEETEPKKRRFPRCKSCDAERTHYGHPTAKPTSLCAWHAKLLRPPPHVDALAIEPFCGSGAIAVEMLGARFRVIAIDLDPRHVEITRERMRRRWEVMLREAEAPVVEGTAEAVKTMPVKKAASSQLGLKL